MSFKIGPLLAGISLLSLFAVTSAGAGPRCGQAPSCNRLYGADLHRCRADRAAAEADCQRRGAGYDRDSRSHRVRGRGDKYYKCRDKERRENRIAAELDDATSMADCR